MKPVVKILIGVTVFMFISFGLAWGIFLATGGFKIDNDFGELVTEERVIEEEFSKVSMDGFGSLEIIQGDQTELTVRTHDQIIEKIQTEVKSDTLFIDEDFWDGEYYIMFFSIDPTLEYTLTVQDLNKVELSGMGTIEVYDFETVDLDVLLAGAGTINFKELVAENVKVALEGAGSLEIESMTVNSLETFLDGAGSFEIHGGSAETQSLELNGLGSFNAENLSSKYATVKIDGAGSANVAVSETLDVQLDGVGSLEYYGNPSVTKDIDGLGSVEGHAD